MKGPVSERVAQEAVRWLVELQDDADELLRRDWQRWRAADPEHERAWQRIESVNRRLRGLPPAAARAAVEGAPLHGRRQVLGMLGLAAVAVPGLWLAGGRARPWLADYRTAVGERRDIGLADGSRLSLNTDSAVNLRLASDSRWLELLRGEIQLEVAPGTASFHIATAQGSLLVEQARFNLRQYADHCRLGVLDGTVRVRCAGHPDLQASLAAGQQIRFDSQRLGAPQPLDAAVAAWRDGMLVARDMRLADFLDELGRYHRGWLGCDPRVANLHLSGTYPLRDSLAILAMLEVALPVRISQRTRWWISVQPRHA
ncbi:Anti-sigma factor, FecR family [Azotobacter vinelandii CA]|uniref:Anti-sigma factor, FecR family n=2 Tax=Azotobacter vinelandii TaxID=354 RepID=C1DJ04_AZOVD|nr:FecR family protein [Azotobacter vinelandii]ACO80823.1 Anti-sigma factor, FecR family [Azotobacter vinelandii DJ]AGK14260.1 Anti-sigma factor, FecR family [Azotobacter vinelandii CA]AGK22180.1 Anti-sigma factor, FecR family [Azotobacter vinelandii CA6]SFX02503.1 FecR family protein [Azotobacter vinelandii]GLK60701.1 sensor [Azotobacter vinelandii]